jgi:hypothetical protein
MKQQMRVMLFRKRNSILNTVSNKVNGTSRRDNRCARQKYGRKV